LIYPPVKDERLSRPEVVWNSLLKHLLNPLYEPAGYTKTFCFHITDTLVVTFLDMLRRIRNSFVIIIIIIIIRSSTSEVRCQCANQG